MRLVPVNEGEYAIIIEQKLIDRLGFTLETEFEVVIEGRSLRLHPKETEAERAARLLARRKALDEFKAELGESTEEELAEARRRLGLPSPK
jgi:hypothetical protein